MSVGAVTLTGVVCDDRAEIRRAVVAVLARCGFQALQVNGYPELVSLVRDVQPTVVVLSLPVVGIGSLAVVGTLLGEAPACEVVVLSAFRQLHLAAIEAGAMALVPEEDPQALRDVLLQVAAQRAGPVEGGGLRESSGHVGRDDGRDVDLRRSTGQLEHET